MSNLRLAAVAALLSVTTAIANGQAGPQDKPSARAKAPLKDADPLDSTIRRNPYDNGSLRIQERAVAEDDYPPNGVQLGQGWDSYLGQKSQAICVDIDPSQKPLEIFEARTSYSDVYDREQLFREMKMSVRASYGAVSGRASFLQQVTIDKRSRNILAKVFVNKGGQFVVPKNGEATLKLSPFALAILTTKDGLRSDPEVRLSEFKRICGDSFVTAIHNGGRYDALFNLQQDKQEVLQQFKASVKGSYGAGSASASVSSLLKKNSQNERLSVQTSQNGGEPGIVPGGVLIRGPELQKGADGKPLSAPAVGGDYYTAENVIKKVSLFESMGEGFAKPYAIAMEQYKVASNWPVELIDHELLPWNMLELQANIWRYRELADLYAQAVGSDTQFYFPFTSVEGVLPTSMTRTDIQKRVSEQAQILYSAADCFEGWVAACASRSSCAFKDVFTPKSLEAVCPALTGTLNLEQRAMIGAMLIGTGPRPEAVMAKLLKAAAAHQSSRAVVKLTDVQVSDLLKQFRRLPLLSAKISGKTGAELAALDATATVTAAGTDKALPYVSPAEIYYELLAESPMVRGPVRGVVNAKGAPDPEDATDESNHVQWLCEATSVPSTCSDFAFSDIAGEKNATTAIATKPLTGTTADTKADYAAIRYRKWVLQTRLIPIVRTYCKVAGHPLCLPPDQALYIANNLSVTFGTPRMFAYADPLPAPAETKVPRNEKYCRPERRGELPCGGGVR